MTSTISTHMQSDRASRLVPDQFRLADVNPLTGVPYSECSFEDLPPYIADAVKVRGWVWDLAVCGGALATLVDLHAPISLAEFLGWVSQRWCGGEPPEHVCGDCWGTLAADDVDGSMTGVIGTVYLCPCVDRDRPWSRPFARRTGGRTGGRVGVVVARPCTVWAV